MRLKILFDFEALLLLKFRCIFMMVLPQLFSDKGRHALLMYAFILSFSGPSKTTLHNTGVLSESLTCLQVTYKFSKDIQRVIVSYNFIYVNIVGRNKISNSTNRGNNKETVARCSDLNFEDKRWTSSND